MPVFANIRLVLCDTCDRALYSGFKRPIKQFSFVPSITPKLHTETFTDLVGMSEKFFGVSRIVAVEDNGGGGHGGSSFSGKVRSRVIFVNSVSIS